MLSAALHVYVAYIPRRICNTHFCKFCTEWSVGIAWTVVWFVVEQSRDFLTIVCFCHPCHAKHFSEAGYTGNRSCLFDHWITLGNTVHLLSTSAFWGSQQCEHHLKNGTVGSAVDSCKAYIWNQWESEIALYLKYFFCKVGWTEGRKYFLFVPIFKVEFKTEFKFGCEFWEMTLVHVDDTVCRDLPNGFSFQGRVSV